MSGFVINPYQFGSQGLLQSIQAAGIPTANLRLCLDAADAASYAGTGQTWTDLSGNTSDFYRGTGSGSDTGDPTFNGAAGALTSSEYWSFDGTNDIFTLVAASNPAWLQTLHKSTARVTIAYAFYLTGGVETIIGDYTGSTAAGFSVAINATTQRQQVVIGTELGGGLSTTGTPALNVAAWNICAFSFRNSSSSIIHQVNGSEHATTGDINNPSSMDASAKLEIGGIGGTSTANPIKATSRLGWLAIWDTNLSSANLTSLFQQTRGRYAL